jgi:hypothetical protein
LSATRVPKSTILLLKAETSVPGLVRGTGLQHRAKLSVETLTLACKYMGAIYRSFQGAVSGLLRMCIEPRFESLIVELAAWTRVNGLNFSQLGRKRVTHYRDSYVKKLQEFSSSGRACRFSRRRHSRERRASRGHISGSKACSSRECRLPWDRADITSD